MTSASTATVVKRKTRFCQICKKDILTCRNYKKITVDVARKITATCFLQHVQGESTLVAGESAGPSHQSHVGDNIMARLRAARARPVSPPLPSHRHLRGNYHTD